MKKILMIFVLLIIAVSLFASGDDGDRLYKAWQAYQRYQKAPTATNRDDCVGAGWYMGYIQGVVDVLIDLEKIEVPDSATWEVGFNLVGKYLEKNPKSWGDLAAYIVFKAFVEAYGYPPEKEEISAPNA
jgi:hypothetical protein